MYTFQALAHITIPQKSEAIEHEGAAATLTIISMALANL